VIPDLARRCGTLIQVALDYTSIRDALYTASRVSGLSDRVILEAGTPLVKSFGLESVSILKALPGGHPVVADLKTMDTGGLEVETAHRYGADASTVLSVASDETIREAVSAASRLGMTIYGDLIDHPNPVERARELEDLGVHVILMHMGIDVQRRLGLTASSRIDVVKVIRREVDSLVAVAGGVKPGDVASLADAGADIIIIGSAITRSRDPRSSLLEALKGVGVECG